MSGSAVIFIVAFAALLGLVIGSFLNVVIYRVPAKVSLLRESRCPGCNSAIRPWNNVPVLSWVVLRGRCADCDEPISARYPLVEAATGAAFALVAWASLASQASVGGSWTAAATVVTIAYLYFAAISVTLTMIDLDTRRLPNDIVLPSYIVAAVLFALASLLDADWTGLLRAAIGGLGLYAFYFVLRLIRPAGMGGGDVKLAGLVGIYLAWLGWGTLVVGAFAAFLLGGVFGIVLLITRRAGRRTAIPFGPWMLAGAWVGIFAGQTVGQWYVGTWAVGS
ncbi:prepilin peptidase [Microbacterium sp. SSM24]|uniref:prepilin peptidase n=1 Tax=Microbacterium sp. SSM24 TaxID=2991714 RepID=UPI0022278057|nr:A24 family peptidase [Microbacterium sp. SSM24]MCW3494791.1 prepilin peptidase [Microbacterium sp. SSM24]